MCEARVYFDDGCIEKEIMADVVMVEPDGNTWICTSVLGERKLVPGTLTKIDFLKHSVHIQRPPDTAGGERSE